MATLGLMPVWGFMYVRSVTEAPEVVEGPLGIGAEEYGTLRRMPRSQRWRRRRLPVLGRRSARHATRTSRTSSATSTGEPAEYNLDGVEIYGNPDREGGPHVTDGLGVMPQQGSLAGGGLTDYEILGVVCHERYTLGGADPKTRCWPRSSNVVLRGVADLRSTRIR